MANLSDFLPSALQVGATVLSAGSQIAKGDAYTIKAQRAKAAADFEAQQLALDAEGSRGVGMRGAQNEAIQGQIINSLALARAAASGAGASDPSVMNIMAQTSGMSAYRQALQMYEGEAQARMDRLRGAAVSYGGDQAVADAATAKSATNIGAASTILSGGLKAMSLAQKYWTPPGSENIVDEGE